LPETNRRPRSPLGALQQLRDSVHAQAWVFGGGRSAKRWARRIGLKAVLLFVFCCSSVLADEGEIHVFSIAHTNANKEIYNKDEFTRDGRTNLVRILRIVPRQGWMRICRFYHAGEVVGNFVVQEGETIFNTEAGTNCMSLKYGVGGEILSAMIGNQQGVLLDEFAYTNGTFSPIAGPLRHQGMKPLFYDEAKFIKEAAEAEARFKKLATGKNSPTSQ
jgi:hypothetical protein